MSQKKEKQIDSIIAGTGKGAEKNVAETYVLSHSIGPMVQRLLSPDCNFTEMRVLGFQLTYEDVQALSYALAESKSLRALSLDHLQIGDYGAKELARGLCYNENLTYLSLRWNNICEEGGVALADALHHNKGLKNLVLAFNNIGDAAGQAFASALKRNQTLEHLDLKWNQIGDDVGDMMLDAMGESKSLSSLFLGGNGSTLRNVGKGVAKKRKSKSMRIFTGNKKEHDEGTMSLEQLKRELAAATLASGAEPEAYEEEEEAHELQVGDLVEVRGNEGASSVRRGRVRFIGETEFAEGIWVGIEFEGPVGKNDGSVNGKRYFNCPLNHGSFLRHEKLVYVDESSA